jgi:hypothetical protein
MKEQLITKETAVLGEIIGYPFYTYPNAPTQSLLQKWLREVHNVYVSVSFNDNTIFEYYYFIHTNVSKPCSNRICSLPFKTNNYEEALEIGLQEALNLINKC